MKYKIRAHFNSMLWTGILNFKVRIVFWNIFFLEIRSFEKRITLSEKKPPLRIQSTTYPYFLAGIPFEAKENMSKLVHQSLHRNPFGN